MWFKSISYKTGIVAIIIACLLSVEGRPSASERRASTGVRGKERD